MEHQPALADDVQPAPIEKEGTHAAHEPSGAPPAPQDEQSQACEAVLGLPVCIQFCSDMHLEMPLETKHFGQHLYDCLVTSDPKMENICNFDVSANVLPRVCQGAYLALLGDVFDGGKIRDGTYRKYLLQQSVGFEAVFVLAGNHEFYRAEHGACQNKLSELCKDVTDELGGSPVVHFLDCGRVDLPGTNIRVLGCTLWSAVGDERADLISKSLNDYSAIRVSCGDGLGTREATVADTNSWHAHDLDWLESELIQAGNDNRRCVVMTHHAPTFHRTAAPEHEGSAIGSAFCTELERLLCPPVSSWLFGHTHWSSWQQYSPNPKSPGEGKWTTLSGSDSGECDASKGQVIVASNQLGYGAMGEHRKCGCHPYTALMLSSDGFHTSLQCLAQADAAADASTIRDWQPTAH